MIASRFSGVALKLTLNLSINSDTTVSGGRLTPEGDLGGPTTDVTESECLLPRIDWETLTASLNQQQEHTPNRNVITYLDTSMCPVASPCPVFSYNQIDKTSKGMTCSKTKFQPRSTIWDWNWPSWVTAVARIMAHVVLHGPERGPDQTSSINSDKWRFTLSMICRLTRKQVCSPDSCLKNYHNV